MPEKVSLNRTAKILKTHESILIVSHIRPDGDCIGSQLALYHLLKGKNKKVKLFNRDGVPERLLFLPGSSMIKTKISPRFHPELIVILDTSEFHRCGLEEIDNSIPTLVIDHHQSNSKFAKFNYLRPRASSVGEMIYDISRTYPLRITENAATCLYLAIMSDTGSFQFSNLTPKVFEIAAKLVKAGADPKRITDEFYNNEPFTYLELEKELLSEINLESDGIFLWTEVPRRYYKKHGFDYSTPENSVNRLRATRGVRIVCVFH